MKRSSLMCLLLSLMLVGCSDDNDKKSDNGGSQTGGGESGGGSQTGGGESGGGSQTGGGESSGGSQTGGGESGGGSQTGGGESGGGSQTGGGESGGSQEECLTTFVYYNQWTNTASGGEANWDVYLVGDFNKNSEGSWAQNDNNYKMASDGNGTHTITVNWPVGSSYEYKYNIPGWGDDGWKTDAEDGESNSKANITTCGTTIGTGNPNGGTGTGSGEGGSGSGEGGSGEGGSGSGEGGSGSGEGGSGEGGSGTTTPCVTTFTYYNQWTNIASGGAADFDVYLVGSFNMTSDGTWITGDSKYKMTSDGKGEHTIDVNWAEGSKYEYKYYVEGWDSDSWKSDNEDGGNGVADINTCGKKFGSGNPNPSTGGDPVTPPSGETSDDCAATFVYVNKYTNTKSGGTADFDVYLVGDMNSWKAPDSSLKLKSDGNGTHTITVNLKKDATYKYKFYVNGWEGDAWRANSNACSDSDCNSSITLNSCGDTVKFVDVALGGDSGSTGGGTVVTPSGSISLAAVPSVSEKQITIKLALADGVSVASVSGDLSDSAVLSEDGKTITDTVSKNGKYVYTVKGNDGSELYVPVWVEDKAFDWHDALLYFAFTDRFKDGDSSNNNPATNASVSNTSNARWMGGDFKGLKEKVDEGYFDDLGVNTLWISSVTMNTQGISWGTGKDSQHSYSAYHSYWPIASFMTDDNMSEFAGATSEGVAIQAIEPHFGSMDDLKDLVDACHQHGIRVIVDFAVNQVHKDSPIFKNPKYASWFNDTGSPRLCDDNNNWDNYSEKCWFSADLPDINYENADARAAMINHAIWLIKKTNIDGFRVDAVKHIAVQFVKDLRAATDKLFANTGIMFYMVGETFTGDVNLLNKYIGDDMLHAQFDFPMYYALQNHILGLGNYATVAQLSNYFKSDLMGTFMGNHDVARALSVAAGQNQQKWGSNSEVNDWLPYLKVKTALTILMTNPGVPLIYYGDEYGMEGSNDPDNRRMMEFGSALNSEQQSMLAYIQKLGQIRKNYPAITRGHRENLSYGGGYWCYKLTGEGMQSIIVGLSRADGGDNSGCSLGGKYKLHNLLDESASDIEVDGLDLNSNRLNVYLVK